MSEALRISLMPIALGLCGCIKGGKMANTEKGLFAVGLATLAAILVFRKKPTPAPTEFGGTLSALEVLDAATGEPVPAASPATVVAGDTYIARITATNASTRGGAAVAATLIVRFSGWAGSIP